MTRTNGNLRSLKNVCVDKETLTTDQRSMSTKDVNKNETKHKATHKLPQHNAKKLVYSKSVYKTLKIV